MVIYRVMWRARPVFPAPCLGRGIPGYMKPCPDLPHHAPRPGGDDRPAPRARPYCGALGLRGLHNIPPCCTCTASAGCTHSPRQDIFTACINIQTPETIEIQHFPPFLPCSEIRQKSHFADKLADCRGFRVNTLHEYSLEAVVLHALAVYDLELPRLDRDQRFVSISAVLGLLQREDCRACCLGIRDRKLDKILLSVKGEFF